MKRLNQISAVGISLFFFLLIPLSGKMVLDCVNVCDNNWLASRNRRNEAKNKIKKSVSKQISVMRPAPLFFYDTQCCTIFRTHIRN